MGATEELLPDSPIQAPRASGEVHAISLKTTVSRPNSASSSPRASLSSESKSKTADSINEFGTLDPSPYSEATFHQFVTMKKGSLKLNTFKRTHKKTSSRDSEQLGGTVTSSTDSERQMYAQERLDNFRWLSKLLGSYADCDPLTEKDEVDHKTAAKVYDICQFAELVYSAVPVELLVKHSKALEEADILQEYRHALGDSIFVGSVNGAKTDLTAYVVFRRSTGQLVVSISGTSKPKHMVQNLRAVRTIWPGLPSSEHVDRTAKDSIPTVHSGFLTLYRDIKSDLEQCIGDGIAAHHPAELVITGHSMGGSVAHLLSMDLLGPNLTIEIPKKMTLATFGAPRTGNAVLVQHFRKLVREYKGQFEEYSVKGYNDGVVSVPPRSLGYVHFCQRPIYAFRRKMYWVPDGQSEASLFHVENSDADVSQENSFPRGGHNYYGRDLEGMRRTLEGLHAAGFPEKPDWQSQFWKDARKGGDLDRAKTKDSLKP